MNKGQELWKKAKNLIPSGNMLLSKNPDLYLPDLWPCYFSEASGIEVKDLDGNTFKDFSSMSVGACSLGYGNEEIDSAVIEAVTKGVMSSLNCPEEVQLAERLIDINPWASQVRFARTGGEANAVSIRIARAYTGKDKIAFCGYHGWHDWYLSANIEDESKLDDHLLPGLSATGVPRNLKGSTLPFEYNNIKQFEKIVEANDIAAVKMEVVRSMPPKGDFLKRIREICTKKNIVLIFDECTSGFRETFGGVHIKYGVTPDLCMFGKALGNGYAITAVVGKEKIMQAAEKTFISSTFWTERIGPTAALKSLEIIERTRNWEHITNIGKSIKRGWLEIAKKYVYLRIQISGIDALATFSIESSDWLKYKTYITQEMLAQGYLASNTVYSSGSHNKEDVSGYLKALDRIMETINNCEAGIQDIHSLLKTPVCQTGFRRLN